MSRFPHHSLIGSLAAVLASTVAFSGVTAASTPAQAAAPDKPAAAPATGGTHRVTLITGDIVTLVDPGPGTPATASVERAPDSVGGVQILHVGDDLHVIPDQAQPFLASGRLDRDLFNVSDLVEQGYDDASVGDIPLIVEYAARMRTIPAAPTAARRGPVLQSIHGAALSADKDRARTFWEAVTPDAVPAGAPGTFTGGIARIHLDEKVDADLAESVAQVGAPEAWAAGLDGTGATVAVLDTGVDQTHPDLSEQVTETHSFVPGEEVADVDGHGTHVASTVLGTGAASDGKEKGVAHGADLIVGKVLDNSGSGLASWIIEGMEWASTRADVVNMSLGSSEASDGTDPMAAAVDELSAETGALFVIAAGNYGRVSGIGSPGAATAALTVGAVDRNDERAYFQDMGPRLGDGGLKPEITAPGVSILAARSSLSPGQGDYVTLSGTSMATPHVAGAAAIVAAQHPTWNGDQIKQALVSTALGLPGNTAYQVGTGRLDVPATVNAEVTATGSLSFGLFKFPHGDDDPVERTITYTNSGAADVTLDLATAVTDDALDPAPEGLLSVPAKVTVPAGGAADVTVTAAPNAGAADTTYSGVVTASLAGDELTRTAVGLVKEPERYDVSISARDREGAPTGGYVTFYRYGDQWVTTLAIDPETGTVPTQRVEPGIYNVTSWLPVSGELGSDSSGVALVGTPHVTVDGTTDLVLDAREANPITVRTPKASEDTYRRPGYFYDSKLDTQFHTFANQYAVAPNIDDMYAAPTGDLPGEFDFATRWRRTAPLLELTAIGGGSDRLTPLYQRGSKRFHGRDRLEAVDGGTGSAADLADVDARGRAVVVTRSEINPGERARAVQDAGARMLVVVNDAPGRLYEPAGGTDLPVLALTAAEGRPILDRLGRGRPVDLQARGTEFPPYLYDLVKSYQGAIPANLRYVAKEADLATITNRFVGASKELAFESRADCRSWHWPPCLQVTEPVQTGSTRVDYVSTEDSGDWYQETQHPNGWELRGDRRGYEPGQLATNTWFDNVVRPRTGSGFWPPRRSGDFFMVNVPEASSGNEGVTGLMSDGTSTVQSSLYADGVLVQTTPYQAVQRSVPETSGWTDYRFVQENTRPGWTYSTSSRTEWNFRAETSGTEYVGLPLLQVDYDLPTDLRGRVAGGRQQIGLTAFHYQGDHPVEGDGKVAGATLHLSYDDGKTWKPVALKPAGDGTWTAKISVPHGDAKFLSLRATAWDDEGNEVEQRVIRAAGVR